MAKQTNQLSVYITTFIVILLSVAFIGSIADVTRSPTDKTVSEDELIDISTARNSSGDVDLSRSNFTVTYYPTGWEIEDCPIASVTYGNATEDWVLDTDYKVYDTLGIIQVLNTTNTVTEQNGNSTYVTYAYCGDGYINQSWARTILDTNVGIFAIAILAAVIYLVYLLLSGREED